MLGLLRRQRPTPAEIIEVSLARGDYKTAATFIVAGCVDVLSQAVEEAPAGDVDRALQLALQRVTASA